MGRRTRGQLPQMRLHRRSGTARIRIGYKEIQLGVWGSAKAHQRYYEVIQGLLRQEDLLRGGRLEPERAGLQSAPQPVPPPSESAVGSGDPDDTAFSTPPACQEVLVSDVCAAFLADAKTKYLTADGKQSSTLGNYKMALRALRPYWDVPAAQFGPRLLVKLRDDLVGQPGRRKGPDGKRLPKFRKTINRTVKAIWWVFKWAVSMELVPPAIYQALKTVEPLKKHRTPALELPKIKAVADENIEKTIAHLPEIVADMVRCQRLTGCRPSELCSMRPCDIDRSKKIWCYRPCAHKNEWRDQERRVSIGPKAQAILEKYLDRPSMRPCFVPAESESKRNAIRRRERKAPMTPSHRARRHAVSKIMDPNKPYTDDTYRRAVQRACRKAGVPVWSPNQLRHAAAEEARGQFGLDGAQARLGHKHANVTEIYAKNQHDKADEVARLLG